MNKSMSARDELIDFIVSMTPEQVDKLLKHPEVSKIMKEMNQEGEKNA